MSGLPSGWRYRDWNERKQISHVNPLSEGGKAEFWRIRNIHYFGRSLSTPPRPVHSRNAMCLCVCPPLSTKCLSSLLPPRSLAPPFELRSEEQVFSPTLDLSSNVAIGQFKSKSKDNGQTPCKTGGKMAFERTTGRSVNM